MDSTFRPRLPDGGLERTRCKQIITWAELHEIRFWLTPGGGKGRLLPMFTVGLLCLKLPQLSLIGTAAKGQFRT
jgi:hypothetical protein